MFQKLLAVCLALIVFAAPIRAGARVEKGFTSLFNGKDLTGWQVMNEGQFSVKDDVILLDKGNGWLRSNAQYISFELRLDFRFVSPGADSGIFLRAGSIGANWPKKNYQVQTMDNNSIAGLFASEIKTPTVKRDVGLVDKARKKTGAWQSYVITANEDRLEIKLNDVVVATADNLAIEPGFIGLQGEGGVLEFKNIRIREIKLADEPLASKFSLQKAGESLDKVALNWTRDRKCGACHTNYFYLNASSAYGAPTPAYKEIRGFFEMRAAGWDKNKPRWDAEVVATASFLAMNDAQTGGKLNPITRAALDRMWTLQKEDGSWKWLKCGWPPFEHDDYFGALVAAFGAGHAPEGYADTPKAKEGIAKLQAYFKTHPPEDLHHKVMLLWASLKVDGLMTPKERQETVDALLAKQRPDGGWCLPSLGDWKRRDESPNSPDAASDGYATGLALYVLREAKLSVDQAKIKAGLDWLKRNQRASGRWYTHSLNNDRYHFITNTGTAFALMALRAWDEK